MYDENPGNTQARNRTFTYVLVMPDGELTVRQDTFQGVRDQIRAGYQGSQEIIDLPSLNPVRHVTEICEIGAMAPISHISVTCPSGG